MIRPIRSTATMARRNEPADGLDFYPTPPWATRALFEHGFFKDYRQPLGTAMDPVCGEGHMTLVLEEYPFDQVFRSDVHDYGQPIVADFLDMRGFYSDWFFLNPPYNKALAMILHALQWATKGVAVLARSAFLEGQERFHQLFSVCPPTYVFQFVERLPIYKGRWAINGSSATAYSWFLWLKDRPVLAPTVHWIPPCRKELTADNDLIRFGACSDLPADHPVRKKMKEAEEAARRKKAA